MRRLIALGLVLLAGLAVAAAGDPRGWSAGQPAAAASQLLGPRFAERVALPLPKGVASKVKGPTLLVYVSTTCPHCKHVAPELGRLAQRTRKDLDVVGVFVGRTTQEQADAFRQAYGWRFPTVIDVDGAISGAMGARSTPSALLVVPDGGEVIAQDGWYPYVPGTDVLVEMRLADSPYDVFAPDRYLGNEACAGCHVQEMQSWLLTHHSIAWKTLVDGEHHEDPACVGCHVTGHEQPGGWRPDAAHETLQDVGCEACHSAGGPHDGQAVDARATCEGCHDAKHSLGFRVDKGLPHLDHFRAVGMEAEAFRAARRTLVAGEAPKALIGFDEGTYVGSSACASCHGDEHAWWAADGHGQAMASLQAQGSPAEDVACVRCHAVPKTPGVPPATVDGYRVEEGVGCEACHGPGGAHVAAEGAPGTIEGLGEDCPVCVVEALCTTCHTRKWDPTWDLDTRLGQVRHVPPPPSAPDEATRR